jgi:hypothetical protein
VADVRAGDRSGLFFPQCCSVYSHVVYIAPVDFSVITAQSVVTLHLY